MAKKDTTRKGVSPELDDEEQPVETRPMTDDINPRRATEMASAIENRKRQIEEEINQDKAEDDPERVALTKSEPESAEPESAEPEPKPADPEPKPAAPEGEKEQPAEQTDPAPAEPVELMVTVNIDGKKREIPASAISATVKVDQESREIGGKDLIDGFQMVSAGQARLREANTRLAEAARKEQENERAEDRVKPQAEAEAEAGETATPTDSALSDDQALAMAKKLQYGNEAEAAGVIRDLAKMNEGRVNGDATPTPDQIADEAALKAVDMTEQRLRQKEDLKTIGGEYPHIIKDPNLMQTAVNFVHRIRAHDLQQIGYKLEETTVDQWAKAHEFEQSRGTVRSNLDVFRLAGEATNEWIKSFGGAIPDPSAEQPNQPKSGFDAKREAKRTMVTPPKPTAAVTTGPQDEKRPLSGSEKVMQMRKVRGQPTAS